MAEKAPKGEGGGRVVLVDRNGVEERVKEKRLRAESWKANSRVEVRGVTLRAGGL